MPSRCHNLLCIIVDFKLFLLPENPINFIDKGMPLSSSHLCSYFDARLFAPLCNADQTCSYQRAMDSTKSTRMPSCPQLQCRYHLFMQNVPDSTEWKFGIVWAHVSSKDLVYWQHHPPALEPGKYSPERDDFFKWDADGCFTGCATISHEGKPTILYTGICSPSHLTILQIYQRQMSRLCMEQVNNSENDRISIIILQQIKIWYIAVSTSPYVLLICCTMQRNDPGT